MDIEAKEPHYKGLIGIDEVEICMEKLELFPLSWRAPLPEDRPSRLGTNAETA